MDQKTIQALESLLGANEKSERLKTALGALGDSIVTAAKRFESNKLKIDEDISRGSRNAKHRFTI